MTSVALPTKLFEVQGHIDPPPEAAMRFEDVAERLASTAATSASMAPTTPYLPSKTQAAAAPLSAEKIPLSTPESFISCRVRCLMSEPNSRSCADAYREAYHECATNGYRLYASDPGYCHGLMAKVLSAPARLMAWIGDALSLAGGSATMINDSCVSVPFECTRGGHIVPRSGVFRLASEGSNLCMGRYELPDTCAEGESYQMRVPIQFCQRIRRNCIAQRLPMQNLYMRCRRMPGNQMCVEDVRLKAYLSPRADDLLDPNACVRRCHSSAACPFEHEPRSACVTTSVDFSDPNQNLEATRASVSEFVNSFLPSQHKWRCYGYIGRTNVANCGNDSPDGLYRIGGVTEPITVMAVLRRLAGRDLHSPSVVEAMLTETGATDVLAGLRACYGGAENLPTLHQLLNHTSSLPEASCFTPEHLRRMLHQNEGLVDESSMSGTSRQSWLGKLLCETRLFASRPGVMHRHSHLNTLIVRHMLPDWRSDDATDLRRLCVDLGMPSANLSTRVSNHAECVKGRMSLEDELNSRPAWLNHVMSHCDGLSARTSELAAMISGAPHNCKHSWADDGSASADYAFVPALERAAVACHRESGTGYGWGWMHGSVLKDVPAFGSNGLRVMFRWGETRCGHTTIACRVPGTRLSFAFNTTAPLNALCQYGESRCADKCDYRPASILGTIGGFVRALLGPMYNAASLHSERARFWDPTLNAALCEMPPQCSNYASHYSYCRGKYPFFAAPLAALRPFIDAGELVSISDGGESYRLSLREAMVEPSERARAIGDQRRLVRYELRNTTGNGECLAHQLVFDPDGFLTNEAARRVTSNSRSMRVGCYRVMCPNTGLLTENVGFHRVKFDAHTDEPCVSYGGRLYLRKQFYQSIRRYVAPSASEQLDDTFAISRSIKESGAPVAEPTELAELGSIASAIQASKPAENAIPSAQSVERGWRGGGWRGGRGWGWGAFGAGVALGAVGAGVYPYAAYPVAPYYRPYIVGYDIYGRPIYR